MGGDVKDQRFKFKRDGFIGRLTLDSPENSNALEFELGMLLTALLDEIGESDLRVLIIDGAGKSFCAGGDIEWERRLADLPRDEARREMRQMQEMMAKVENLPQAVICQLHGYVVGGGAELAMACDIRVGVPSAAFMFPEVKLGVVAPCGATQRLARLIGPGRAKYLLLTGEMITGKTALEWGLLDFLEDDKQVDEFVEETAEIIAEQPPDAVRMTKEITNSQMHHELESERELDAFIRCSGSAANKEALDGLLRKKST